MNNLKVKFYNDKICLNVLTKDIENAREIYEATKGHVLLGVLSKNYPTVEAAIEDMKKYSVEIENAVSVGLGAGSKSMENGS